MTELLVGSDFHLGALLSPYERDLAGDVVPVYCGDLVRRPRDDASAYEQIVARWEAANPALVFVPGNHEPEDCGRWEGIRVHERGGLRFLALPVTPLLCRIPTWTHEHSEARIADLLSPWRGGDYDVVVSHAPPRGVCDRIISGQRVGSTALAAFAETIDFRLWLCGHVHECGGTEGRIAGRPLLNAARTILRLPAPPAGRPLRARPLASAPPDPGR